MHETSLWYEKCPLHLACDYSQPYNVVLGTSVTVSLNPRERGLGCEDRNRERGWVIKILHHHHHLDWAELKVQNLNRYLGCFSKQVYPTHISNTSS